MMISANFPNLVDPVLDHVYSTSYAEGVQEMGGWVEKIYTVKSNSRSVDRSLGLGGLSDLAEFTGTFHEDSISEQYVKTFTPKAYDKKVVISKQLFEEDEYDEVKQFPEEMGYAAARTRTKNAVSIFAQAFNTASTSPAIVGDTLSLCNSAHTSTSSDGANQSNTGTTALSYSAILSTRLLMRKFRNDRNELIHVVPDVLLVPVDLESTARKILESDLEPDTTDNNANVATSFYGKKLELWVCDWLTDTNNWFLINKRMMKKACRWYDKVKDERKTVYDHDRRAIMYSVYERYSFGVSDWRWLYGHNVA